MSFSEKPLTPFSSVRDLTPNPCISSLSRQAHNIPCEKSRPICCDRKSEIAKIVDPVFESLHHFWPHDENERQRQRQERTYVPIISALNRFAQRRRTQEWDWDYISVENVRIHRSRLALRAGIVAGPSTLVVRVSASELASWPEGKLSFFLSFFI